MLIVFGGLLLLGALGAFLIWRRQSEDTPTGALGRNARLVVTGTAVVDDRRRLVLVRRDDVEHLLLIGGPSDIVVESNIMRQRAAGVASVAKPALVRQNEAQQDTRAATAATVPPMPSDIGPSAKAEGAAQERFPAAGAELPRQTGLQPSHTSQPAARQDEAEAPYRASPAVAGLAAGLAALTAATGSRARTETPKEEGTDAQRAKSVAGEAPNRSSVEAEPAFPDGGDEDRPWGVSRTATVQSTPAARESSTSEQGQAAPEALTTDAIGARQQSAPLLPMAEPGKLRPDPEKPIAEPEPPARDGMPERHTYTESESRPAAMATSKPALSDRIAPVADQGPKGEATVVRAAGEHAPPVQAAVPAGEWATWRDEPVKEGHGGPGAMPEKPGAQALAGPKAEPDREEAVPSGSPDLHRLDRAAADLSGFRPSRGATLGDLAGRLEEVLIRKAASGPDSDLGAATPVGAETLSPNPAPPEHDEVSPVGLSARQRPAPPPGQRQQAVIAETDEAAVIDFAGRRRTSGDSLEEEMARLLGELTRDTSRR